MSIQAISTALPQSSPEASAAAREARVITPVQANSKTADPAPVSKDQLNSAIKSVQEYIQPFNNTLEFSVNDDTKQVVVKIVHSTTNQVIRQIPSEEMIAIAKTLDRIIGLFVKQKA